MNIYIPLLAETDSEQALSFINSMQVDILMAYITAIDIALKNDDLDEAERKYKQAARIWPENALVKCYQVLLNYALYKKFNQQDFLDKANDIVKNLGEAQNELELSMQVRIQMFMQEVSGETVPEITKQFCEDNQLYWAVMNKELLNEIYEVDASEAVDFISNLNSKKCTIKITGKLNNSEIEKLGRCIKKNIKLKLSLDFSNCLIKELPADAFRECQNLYNIILPNTIITIGDEDEIGSFVGCLNLQTINIPDSVTAIYNNPFGNCPKLKIVLSKNNQHFQIIDNVLYNKKISKLISNPCSNNIFSINIPNSVLEIDNWAFCGCNNLTSISIPDSVTRIGSRAFSDCTSLKDVIIPNSVTEIETGTFKGCTSLKDVIIPDSVTRIGMDAFAKCISLTNISIPNSVTEIGMDAFNKCISLTNISIPNSVTEICCFEGCTNLVNVTLPDSIKTIYECAFTDCLNLKTISIPKNCEVEDDAFDDGIKIIRR